LLSRSRTDVDKTKSSKEATIDAALRPSTPSRISTNTDVYVMTVKIKARADFFNTPNDVSKNLGNADSTARPTDVKIQKL
jgi:hypothetical protein